MIEKNLVTTKTKITELIAEIFEDIDKFIYKGNESAGIRTRKNLIELSKTFKTVRKEMLNTSNTRKQHKKEFKSH